MQRTGAFRREMAAIAQSDGRAAGHVVLHLVHVLGRLDRDAAGVERDALADEPEHGAVHRVLRLVPQHDEARRLLAAARDAEQQAHLQLGDRCLVEHLDAAGRPPSAICAARSANTRGVRLLPGSFASSRAMLCTRRARARARPPVRSRPSTRPTRSSTRSSQHVGWSPVLYEAPSKLARTTPSASTWAAVSGATRCAGAMHAPRCASGGAAARRARRSTAMRRSRSAVKSLRGPGADQRHARGLPAADGRGKHVERLARELAARPGAADLAAGRGIQIARSPRSSSSKTGMTRRSASISRAACVVTPTAGVL